MQSQFAPVRRAALAALVLVPLILAGCSSSTEPRLIVDQGTVRYETLEGGFFSIRSDRGRTYDPINLPAEAQVDGQRVKFVARSRPDLVSHHMVGMLIEIQSLELIR
jgi:hypothetical protein